MKKIALALAATSFASAPAFAGTYLNTEVNNGYYGSEYIGRSIELHIGAEGTNGKVDSVSYTHLTLPTIYSV